MSNEALRKRVVKLAQDAPKGTLTYVKGRYARDESGRPYVVKPLDRVISDRKYYATRANGGRHESFIWSVIKNVGYVVDSLTPAQRGYLLIISSYIDYDGRIIKSEENKTPMTAADMREVLRLKPTQRSTLSNFLNACLNAGIMALEDDVYYIRRQFHFRGTTFNERVVRTMITRLREMAGEMSANDIGLLYGVIPYVHVDSNYLCANPEERDLRKVRRLNQREVAEKIGVHPKSLTRLLGRMTYREHPMFAKVTVRGRSYYMVSPLLFVRNIENLTAGERLTFGIMDGELVPGHMKR